ncbi:MAG TPA: hypothetical protein VLM37_01730 [Fibrobacteraceae bacterium]|nr:hypothetical protein [Fibrobacteraceae bacterium]
MIHRFHMTLLVLLLGIGSLTAQSLNDSLPTGTTILQYPTESSSATQMQPYPTQVQPNTTVQQHPTPRAVPSANPYLPMVDSLTWYLNRIERLETSSRKLNRVGNVLLCSGIFSAGLATILMVHGSNTMDENDSYYDDDENYEDGESEYIMGVLILYAAGAVITTGTVFKIVAGSKYRRSVRTREAMNLYKWQHKISFDQIHLEFRPNYDLAKRRTEANLVATF